ncbi:hypothetical protein ACHAQJ_005553 [Trichoderma viride]
MRADSIAVALAACLSVGLCDTNNAAPQCAVDCASSIRNEKGSLDLEVICADKLMTNSVFQCLIGSCPQDFYGPAVAHVVMACSDLGLNIGPLHPVEIQHVNLEKPQYLPTPSLPAAYGTPSDPSQQGADHVTLAFDISIDLKCNSGSDGLVTVSLPPPIPSTPPVSPSPPAPAPGPENGSGEGQGEGENGNGHKTASSTPAEQTQATADPAGPSTTSSCPPDSEPSSVQDPSSEHAPPQSTEHAPPQSTELGDERDPAVTSAPSPTSPDGSGPDSPASESPCSTASEDTGGQDPEDSSQSGPSPSPTNDASDLLNDDGKPDVSATSNVEGLPAPAPPTPAPASSTCSTSDGTETSVNPIPGSQLPHTTELTTAAQPSSRPCTSSSPTPTSLIEQEPPSTIHPTPLPLPSPPLYQTADESRVRPPEYAPSGLGEQSPSESSAFETSLPESNTEPLPQENHSSEVEVPSYGQGGLTVPAPAPTSQTDALAGETVNGKPTGKTTEPSVVTLWPTANRTLCTTGPAGRGGPSTTTCEPDGKRTVATAHPPRSMLSGSMKDVSAIGGAQQNEPLGSVMVRIIRPGENSAETMVTTLWGNAPSATPIDAGHHNVVSSGSATQTGFSTLTPRPDTSSIQSNDTATGSSLPMVALANSDSKLTPYLCTMVLLVILISGTLMS